MELGTRGETDVHSYEISEKQHFPIIILVYQLLFETRHTEVINGNAGDPSSEDG